MNEVDPTWNPNLLKYKDQLRILVESDKKYIFCRLRRTYLVLQPEEMVRQLVINYLLDEVQIREKSIQVEKNISASSMDRVDLAVYGKGSAPFLLIECKSWEVELNRLAINQISRYNLNHDFPHCWITNGKDNLMYGLGGVDNKYENLDGFPDGYK